MDLHAIPSSASHLLVSWGSFLQLPRASCKDEGREEVYVVGTTCLSLRDILTHPVSLTPYQTSGTVFL